MSYITRTQPTTDETPPWQGISFTCPVGSDLLADRLKYAYPDCKTLRQRKHQAAINFLAAELEEMKSKDEKHSATPEVHDNHRFGSPKSELNDFHETSTGSTQQNTSPCTSPTTPQSVESPLTDRSRLHLDQLTGLEHLQPPVSTTTATSQTFVFSAIDGRPLQPKTKRKMTSEERLLYKETRKRGACHKCKRMKGRCTHGDNAEMPDSKQIAKRRSSPTPDQDPLGSAKLRKFEGPPDVLHQSLKSHQLLNCSSEAPSTYHDGSNAPSNLQDSLVTEPSSRQNGQWSAGISREGQSDQLYVHTNQLQQEPPRRLSPGLQGPEWSYPGDGYEAIYPGISSSPSRPFHSPFSPAIGYNEFPSFSPGLDPWNSQGHAMENHEPT